MRNRSLISIYKENLDRFPERYYLSINRTGRNTLGSYFGVFFTLIGALLVLIYGSSKFTTLLERPKSAMKVQTSTERGVFNADHEFKSSDGLSIAAMITRIDGD